MKNFQVSKNFSYYELTNSKSHPELLEANRKYFLVEPYLNRLTVFAESMLEEIRYAVDAPVIVNSCGRCPELNAVLGGIPASGGSTGFPGQHLFSLEGDGASDITVPGQDIEVVAFKIWNNGIIFYQMRVYKKKNFIHIGAPKSKNNFQIYFPESEKPGWTK